MRFLKAVLPVFLIGVLLITISSDASAQRKRKQRVPEEANLDNTYWRLYEIDGKTYETPADQREVYIKLLEKKSMLEGYTGCNIITGNYELGKETLTFTPSTTERLCDDMTTESYVLEALNNADRYEINQHYLLLFNGTYMLALFEAKYFEDEADKK